MNYPFGCKYTDKSITGAKGANYWDLMGLEVIGTL
jgi:hypothetical protein